MEVTIFYIEMHVFIAMHDLIRHASSRFDVHIACPRNKENFNIRII